MTTRVELVALQSKAFHIIANVSSPEGYKRYEWKIDPARNVRIEIIQNEERGPREWSPREIKKPSGIFCELRESEVLLPLRILFFSDEDNRTKAIDYCMDSFPYGCFLRIILEEKVPVSR